MFVRGDVQPAHGQVVASLDKERELELLPSSHAWGLVGADLPPEVTLRYRVAISTGRSFSPQKQSSAPAELVWKNGLVTVNTPHSKAAIGFAGGKRIKLGSVIIEAGQTIQDGWCAITATEMRPGHWLITATGYAENTGMGWKNAAKTTVGRDWGKSPSLVEGIPATVTLAGAFNAWSLDERGQRRAEVPVRNGKFEIGPHHQTLWYEVQAR